MGLHGAAMTHASKLQFLVTTLTSLCRKTPFSWTQRMTDGLRNGLLNPFKLLKAQKLPVQASMACLLPDSGKDSSLGTVSAQQQGCCRMPSGPSWACPNPAYWSSCRSANSSFAFMCDCMYGSNKDHLNLHAANVSCNNSRSQDTIHDM